MSWRVVITMMSYVTLMTSPSPVVSKDEETKVGWIEEAREADATPTLNPFNFKFQRAPHLRVAAESWPPHIRVGPDGAKGPMGNLLDCLSKSINFTYSVVQGDGYWGAPQANGSWNGMIGLILKKEVDFGLGPFGLSPVRNEVVDFTIPLFKEDLHILVERPTAEDNPWGFLSPFTWHVWIGLLLTTYLVAGTLASISRILKVRKHQDFMQHLWQTYAIFIGQNLKADVRSLALRVSLFSWMAAILIVMKSYGGTLTSLLAVKTIPIKYDSLRDVLDDPKMHILMEGSTVLSDYLKKAESGIYKELAEAVEKRGAFVRASDMQVTAYSLIPRGYYAMLLEGTGCNNLYSDHFRETGRCDFYMSKEIFWPLLNALVVPKGSPLRRPIESKILALRGFGIYTQWAMDQTPHASHCIKMPTKIKVQKPYSIVDLWAVFLMTACGFLIATIVFSCESLYIHCQATQIKPAF